MQFECPRLLSLCEYVHQSLLENISNDVMLDVDVAHSSPAAFAVYRIDSTLMWPLKPSMMVSCI